MLDQSNEAAFAALADATRRAILTRLAEGPAAVTVLAEPHSMALPSFLRHVEVLEQAQLVTSEKVGRSRIVTLHREGMQSVLGWLTETYALRETVPASVEYAPKRVQPWDGTVMDADTAVDATDATMATDVTADAAAPVEPAADPSEAAPANSAHRPPPWARKLGA